MLVGTCPVSNGSIDEKENVMSKMFMAVVAGASVLAAASLAQATPVVNVPEIDPASASSAVALVTGGLLILAARFRK